MTGEVNALEEVKSLISGLREYLERTINGYTENNVFKPGIMPTLNDHERRITALETDKTQRLNWKNALGLSLAGGLLVKGVDWILNHLK